MQNEAPRKRRYAIDSDSTEEYEQLAELCQSQPNIYYDDKKIEQLRKLKGLQKNGNGYHNEIQKIKFAFEQFEGFDHNYESPNINYVDPGDLPPELRLNSQQSLQEEIVAHNVMILGEISDQYCKNDKRKNSEEFSTEDLQSPLRSKVLMDIAVKKIAGKNVSHVIKFLIYDLSLEQKYETLVELYVKQCDTFIILHKMDQLKDFNICTVHEYIVQLNHKPLKIFYLGYYDDYKIVQLKRENIMSNLLSINIQLIEISPLNQLHHSLQKIVNNIIDNP